LRKPNACWVTKSPAPASEPGPPAKDNYREQAMPVPILKQGAILIATVQAALTDSDTERLREDLMEKVSRFRAQGIVVDVTAIDVMDSFAARSLRTIAHMTRLRGATTVIVGLQPEVAFAMVQLGLAFDDMSTALDLEEGIAVLHKKMGLGKSTIGRDGGG
jgi:rsbT antagonist protein RsbS